MTHKESHHFISYSSLLASVILGVGEEGMKLFYIKKLHVFHSKQCFDPGTVAFLPFYFEIGFGCAWISRVSQNPTCFICFAMKEYHYSSLYAFC